MNALLTILDKNKFKKKEWVNALINLRQDMYIELSEGVVLSSSDDSSLTAVAKRIKGLKDDQYFVLELNDGQCYGDHPKKEELTTLWSTYLHERIEKTQEFLLQTEAFSGYREWIRGQDQERARLRKRMK